MRRLTILVADDEAIIRLGLKNMLTEMGHQVLLAANGREALNIARTAYPDFAILDVRMPLTDGIETAKVLARKHPMPILILTAFGDQDLIEKAAELPIQGYLIKPINEKNLGAAITVALKRFQESQAAVKRIIDLQDDLETRKLLDRAKGVLMQNGMSEDEAYHALQKRARDERLSLKDIAEKVISKQ